MEKYIYIKNVFIYKEALEVLSPIRQSEISILIGSWMPISHTVIAP